MWSETFVPIGQPVLCQVRLYIEMQMMQGIVKGPENGLFEKTAEVHSYFFRLVAEKGQCQVQVLCRDKASMHLFLKSCNPVDGMPVGDQCDKQSSGEGLSAGFGMA